MARFSKEEIRQMVKDRPEGTSPQDVIDALLAKGHDLEGYVAKGPQGECGPEGPRGPIGPTGPQGIPGMKGDRGEAGPAGRDGRDGRDGQDGKDGKDGKDGSPDTGDQIIEKINGASEQIDYSRIKNLPPPQIINQGGFRTGGYETPIKAGTNVTVTKDPFGAYVISSTATGGTGGSSYQQPTSGAVDGTNTVFTWASAPSVIVVDGLPRQKTQSDGTVNWTGTTTTPLAIPPNFDIFGL